MQNYYVYLWHIDPFNLNALYCCFDWTLTSDWTLNFVWTLIDQYCKIAWRCAFVTYPVHNLARFGVATFVCVLLRRRPYITATKKANYIKINPIQIVTLCLISVIIRLEYFCQSINSHFNKNCFTQFVYKTNDTKWYRINHLILKPAPDV